MATLVKGDAATGEGSPGGTVANALRLSKASRDVLQVFLGDISATRALKEKQRSAPALQSRTVAALR